VYLEIGLAQVVDPATVHAGLAEALPDGLDVLRVVESPGGSLADLLIASRWTIALPADSTQGGEALAAAVAKFLATEQTLVERMTKKGLREFDCRAAVVSLAVREDTQLPTLDLVLRQTVPAVRPDDVLAGLALATGDEVELTPAAPLMTRLAQGPLDEVTGTVGDPLAGSPA